MTLPHRDPPQTGHHYTSREIGSERRRDRVGVRERGLKERERIIEGGERTEKHKK